jgi:hypothetical protein
MTVVGGDVCTAVGGAAGGGYPTPPEVPGAGLAGPVFVAAPGRRDASGRLTTESVVVGGATAIVGAATALVGGSVVRSVVGTAVVVRLGPAVVVVAGRVVGLLITTTRL